MSISENLSAILSEIEVAATAVQREASAVRLVAVSKTKPHAMVQAAADAGQLDFGENRVQELVEKAEAFPQLRWHMIGGLQRNKVKYIASFIHLIHSVDSERLLAEINKQGGKHNRQISCLLQLNISSEDQKGGFTEEAAAKILQEIDAFPHVQIKGLMGMAEFTDDSSVIQSQFNRLRMAAEAFRQYEGDRISMDELSMGMSGDFPIAIAEGATLVRVGSAIFGGR